MVSTTHRDNASMRCGYSMNEACYFISCFRLLRVSHRGNCSLFTFVAEMQEAGDTLSYHLLGAIEDGYLARSAPSRRHESYTRLPGSRNAHLIFLFFS